jgi:sigma-B regulation protein RsbU (phosphoserine phosphatase)
VPARLQKLAKMLGRLGMAFFALLVAYTALRFAAPHSGVTFLAAIAFYVTGILFAVQLARRNARRLTWRLRNRLIVAYLFIAFVPIALIAILAALAVWELVGGTAVYLVSSELERRTNAMDGVARMLAETPAEKRQNSIHEVIPYLEQLFPRSHASGGGGGHSSGGGVTLTIRDEKIYRYPADSDAPAAPAAWKDASGLVMKDGQLLSWAHVTRRATEVTLVAPVTRDLLAELAPNIGQVSLIPPNASASGVPANLPSVERTRRSNRRLAEPANRFDVALDGLRPVYSSYWDAPEKQAEWILIVHTRPSIVLGTVFGQVNWAQGLLTLFVAVAATLLLVWVVSLLMGISLTRTITGAIHNLYEGTERIKGGDFSHRIAVEGHDQLAELALSFNGMTENLERLFVVEKEQERLQSEIAIAREVQSQLFPRGALAMKTIELTGVCHPARMVSGDYYDFIRLQDANLAVAIGDVAGKGISAALLMASIQSIMRTQLTAGIPIHAATAPEAGNGDRRTALSVAELVSQLNKQVCANTAPEKFATFYFGLYDDESRVLTYTNAGHLPPILMRDGQAERLEVTGTVVGAFPFARYEEKTIQLRAGDLLVAFTDGIVEPENAYGEAFGEEKLIDLLLRYEQREPEEIMTRIMETVEQWTGASELSDDMTLLVARGV